MRHFKHSVLANEELRSVQEQMGFSKLKVKQEVDIRWNSTFAMIQRLLDLKKALCVAATDLPEFLVAEEWKVIEDCIEVLKPINE